MNRVSLFDLVAILENYQIQIMEVSLYDIYNALWRFYVII